MVSRWLLYRKPIRTGGKLENTELLNSAGAGTKKCSLYFIRVLHVARKPFLIVPWFDVTICLWGSHYWWYYALCLAVSAKLCDVTKGWRPSWQCKVPASVSILYINRLGRTTEFPKACMCKPWCAPSLFQSLVLISICEGLAKFGKTSWWIPAKLLWPKRGRFGKPIFIRTRFRRPGFVRT